MKIGNPSFNQSCLHFRDVHVATKAAEDGSVGPSSVIIVIDFVLDDYDGAAKGGFGSGSIETSVPSAVVVGCIRKVPARLFTPETISLGRRPNGFLGLSLKDRTVLFLVILLDKTVSVG